MVLRIGDRVKIRTTSRRCRWDCYGDGKIMGKHSSAAVGMTGTVSDPDHTPDGIKRTPLTDDHTVLVTYDRNVSPNSLLGGFWGGWYSESDLSSLNEESSERWHL